MSSQFRISKLAPIIAFVFFISSFQVAPAQAVDLKISGPAGKIHGADISRWQHPNDKPINFKKMRKAGLDFVMIKASDTRDDSDRLAVKYLKQDRTGAQEAGIHTGFYHYALLPNVSTKAAIQRDARAQAQKAIWRIGSLGGFNELDLPYALDLENNCIQWSSSNSCIKTAKRTHATLWAKTFLTFFKDKTGRTPLIYSSPHFLENALKRDKELSKYPLWIAQYTIDPAKPGAKPNVKASGCFVHSWTTSQCSANWTVWQYTSCGIAPKYGVPGSRLDLNIFSGGIEKFQSLLTGTWVPDPHDEMPVGETTTITVSSVLASTTNKKVVISVDVTRPDSSAVVTGSVQFRFAPSNLDAPVITQFVSRETSGRWKISVAGIPAGSWLGNVEFKDASGTHSDIVAPIAFTVEQGPTPTPKPTKKPAPKPVFDSCRNQIKN
ncbi:Acm Lyzozyme M1 (1,4-beta-N-acetylmuramidase) [Candidatus Nanopelagicaceae bacterium]